MGGMAGGGGGGVPCFRAGTRILTLRGEVAVEDLSTRDVAITASGEKGSIRWIGWRRYAIPSSGPERGNALPIRFSRDALADGVPKRDLYVSPLHGLYLDGILIPAVALVNGTTIKQCDEVTEIICFQVELVRHSVLLAEGAPAESFLEGGDNRAFFTNAMGVISLRADVPDFVGANGQAQWRLRRVAVRCLRASSLGERMLLMLLHLRAYLSRAVAPVVFRGRAVDKARQRLAMRADALAAQTITEAELRISA